MILVDDIPTEEDSGAPAPQEPAHARYNPSSLKLWEICPSYLNRKDDIAGAGAEMGTRLHHALEHNDPSGLKSDEEVELFEATRGAVDDIILHNISDLGLDPTSHNEIRLTIDLTPEEETFGTCDKLLVSADETFALALDYKMGLMAIDDAEVNAQVAAYSVGIFQRFPKLERLRFYLIVPRQDEISVADFTRADAANQRLRVSTIIKRAKELGGAVFKPAPNLCEFCGRQATCNALAEKALVLAKKYRQQDPEGDEEDYDAFPLPDRIHGSEIDSPEEIAKLLNVARVLKGWSDGVWERARELAFEEGWDLPGYKKVEVKSRREIKEAAAAIKVLGSGTKFDLPLDELLTACSGISVTKLEEVVKAKAPRGKKASFWEEAVDELRDNSVLTGGDTSSWQLWVDRNHGKEKE